MVDEGTFYDRLYGRQCPTCEARIERMRKVGCCAYADPCGHRIGNIKMEAVMEVWARSGL